MVTMTSKKVLLAAFLIIFSVFRHSQNFPFATYLPTFETFSFDCREKRKFTLLQINRCSEQRERRVAHQSAQR